MSAAAFYRERVALLLKHALPTLWLAGWPRQNTVVPAQEPPRILVTCLAGIGDFVLLTPFLRELRRNYRHSDITLVVSPNSAPIAIGCPHVDRVLTLERGPSDPILSRPRNLGPFVDYLRYVASFANRELVGRIDLAIQPKWDADPEFATLLAVLSQAAQRVGYEERASMTKRWCNFGQDRLFTDLLPASGVKHETERGLDVIRYLGGTVEQSEPDLWTTAEDERNAAAFLAQQGVHEGTSLVAFGIGASQGRRHWPHYAELIESLHALPGFTPLLLAGPSDGPLVKRIMAARPTALVANDLPLTTVIRLLSRCAVFVGNDSGPMHLAAAARCPIVEISCHPLGADPAHGNSPERFGPVTDRKAILRPRPASVRCSHGCVAEVAHCIANIAVDEVANAVLQQLRSPRAHGSLP